MANATVINKQKQKTQKIESKNFSIIRILETKNNVNISSVLPFRVRFENITVPGYSYPNNVAPIGIAIIGINNYIL